MATINPQNAAAVVPMGVPGMNTTIVYQRFLPGLVIFVHGVNSDGEWYDAAEEGLCAGLNQRLGLNQAADPLCRMRPVQYLTELNATGSLNRNLSGANFISDPGFSPVIRFRWGYKAAGQDGTEGSQDEKQVYKSKIYLNEMDAWGGGPFQNGTSALPYMWGEGVDDRVFWWLYANMFPVDGREVFASPPRAYFAHAAHRLKELIKLIRGKQPDCPITVVCHSQGNMVSLGAALLGEKEGAIADTYVLCNPPYSLESLGMDNSVNHDSRSAYGERGGVTSASRKRTFANFLQAVKARAGQGQRMVDINQRLGFKSAEGKTIFELGAFPARPLASYFDPTPGVDRDNRGRVFLYCNPHDQVIGVKPVEGIGWKGVSQQQMKEIGADGVFHQRVWAQSGGDNQTPPFQVGHPQWTERSYAYRLHNHSKAFWNPPSPPMRYSLAFNEQQGWVSKIITTLTSPVWWLVTRVPGLPLRINDEPDRGWEVPINAPVLPDPVTPMARRYGQVGAFDEGKDPAADALARGDQKAQGQPNAQAHGGAYQQAGLGDAGTEASLRYEHEARLRAARARGDMESEEDERAAIKRMLAENPNATDHSTILTNPRHSEQALAYDVAVGWVASGKISNSDLHQFRVFAHWMVLKDFGLNEQLKGQFVPYWREGFYNNKQLQRTYTLDHMVASAPGIVDERERGFMGYIKA